MIPPKVPPGYISPERALANAMERIAAALEKLVDNTRREQHDG